MLLHKLRLTALSLLLLAVAATGAGLLTRALAMKDGRMKNPASHSSRPAAESDRPDRGIGSRSGPDDRYWPCTRPGRQAGRRRVPVDIVGRPRAPWVCHARDVDPRVLLGQWRHRRRRPFPHRCRRALRRTASSRSTPWPWRPASVWAGPTQRRCQAARGRDQAPSRAGHRGKLVDVHGQPAAGVELQVLSVGPANVRKPRAGTTASTWAITHRPRDCAPGLGPVTTDDQGRFTITGIGRDVTVGFHVRDRRFAEQDFRFQPMTAMVRGDSHASPQARRGSSRAASWPPTPASRFPMHVVSAGPRAWAGGAARRFRADDEGRFTVNRATGQELYAYRCFPADGQPYLIRPGRVKWTKGAVRRRSISGPPRGSDPRQGDRSGNRPSLAGASVQFIPMGTAVTASWLSGWQAIVASKEDGSFQIAVPPGKGHLLHLRPDRSDYVLEEIGGGTIYHGQPGGCRYYAHAIIPYEVKAGDPAREVNAALRPGKTVKGRVEGPGGETVDRRLRSSRRSASRRSNPTWRGDYHTPGPRWPLRAARGLAPGGAHSRIHSSIPSTSGARRSRSPASRPARS